MLGYTASQDAALGKARVWILMVSFLLKRQIHALLDFGKFLFSPYNLLLLETFTWVQFSGRHCFYMEMFAMLHGLRLAVAEGL
ncbi:hypothetical protein MUK42_16520 [Musa troglodytarum]|uniref:Uncharacterized protein n=1 Tax=Musa troglodytarum TaxID=320322 RepID=A0A9E7HRU6_9LILI|nr:hypothetical protein MUK42_16520 [Musa troglodytarum]